MDSSNSEFRSLKPKRDLKIYRGVLVRETPAARSFALLNAGGRRFPNHPRVAFAGSLFGRRSLLESMVKMVKYPPLMSVGPFTSRLVFDHFLNSELPHG